MFERCELDVHAYAGRKLASIRETAFLPPGAEPFLSAFGHTAFLHKLKRDQRELTVHLSAFSRIDTKDSERRLVSQAR